MKSRVTTNFSLLLALLLSAFWVGGAFAQAPELGDEFIFFVNGTNVLVPDQGFEVADDPLNPGSGNKVFKLNYGSFRFDGFRWDRNVGVDLSANTSENVGEGDSIFFRILVDTANAGKPKVKFAILDKTDDSGAGDGTADLGFRLNWEIPEDMRDGAWHDIALALPPTTWQALEDAKTAGTLDPLSALWVYGGTWSNGGFGVGRDGLGPNTAERPELWAEFEWDAIRTFGVHFDHNTGGGPIYLDDLYIGSSSTDLAAASNPASAMSGVTFGNDGSTNVVSWTHSAEYGGYNVYVSEDPISDVAAEGIGFVGTVPFNADAFEQRHTVAAPLSHLANGASLYYAVTSLSTFGVENTDVSGSSGSITNDLDVVPSYFLQFTEEEADIIFDNASTGVVSNDGFPVENIPPYFINETRFQKGDGSKIPERGDEDLSGEFWFGYNDQFNEWYMYAEVRDDSVSFGHETITSSNTWQVDSIELIWGSYEVESFLFGSAHTSMLRGEEPDYAFRIAPVVNDAGEVSGAITRVGWSGRADDFNQAAATAAEFWEDDQGNVIGYKVLSVMPLDQITADEDILTAMPAAGETKFIPFVIALNDKEIDDDRRSVQIVSSTKSNVTTQFWNTPSQWELVAFRGRETITGVDDEALPEQFALDQNYPNPFNPATNIRFQLATSELITLTVYDLLGRQVATLFNETPMAAGQHSVSFDARSLASGVYLYRLEAGSAFTQTRRMLLVK